MWQVTEANKVPTMKVISDNTQCATFVTNNKALRYYYRWWVQQSSTVKLVQPPHIVLTTARNHTFNKQGADNIVFKFICDDDWEIISTAPDWCYVSDEQKKGGRTNGEQPVFIYIDPYDTGSDTKAHTRQALIIVRNTVTKQVQTIIITQSNR